MVSVTCYSIYNQPDFTSVGTACFVFPLLYYPLILVLSSNIQASNSSPVFLTRRQGGSMLTHLLPMWTEEQMYVSCLCSDCRYAYWRASGKACSHGQYIMVTAIWIRGDWCYLTEPSNRDLHWSKDCTVRTVWVSVLASFLQWTVTRKHKPLNRPSPP